MAVLHLAADDGARAREDAVRALAEEGHPVVTVDERDVHRERLEDAKELLEGERAGGELDCLCGRQLHGAFDGT